MVTIRYIVNPKHRARNPTPDATVWTISEWEELRLFAEAGTKEWRCEKKCLWNLVHCPKEPIGKDMKGDVWVSKFVGNHNNEWHGYPVRAIGHDIPPAKAMQEWVALQRMDLATQAKMKKGQL